MAKSFAAALAAFNVSQAKACPGWLLAAIQSGKLIAALESQGCQGLIHDLPEGRGIRKCDLEAAIAGFKVSSKESIAAGHKFCAVVESLGGTKRGEEVWGDKSSCFFRRIHSSLGNFRSQTWFFDRDDGEEIAPAIGGSAPGPRFTGGSAEHKAAVAKLQALEMTQSLGIAIPEEVIKAAKEEVETTKPSPSRNSEISALRAENAEIKAQIAALMARVDGVKPV